MSDIDFYNHNCYRMYPLTNGTYDSPAVQPWLIADMGVVFYDWTGFDPDDTDHYVTPVSVALQSSTQFVFQFNAVSPGAAMGNSLSMVIGEPLLSETSVFQLLTAVFTVTVRTEQRTAGHAWLVVGDINRAEISGAAQAWDSARANLHRSKIQVLTGHYVDRFQLRNEQRLFAISPCNSSSGVSESYPLAPHAEAIQGEVRFVEGHNCSITTLPRASALRFAARRGLGLGEACEEIPRTLREESRLAQGKTLDHAIRCDDVVSFIGGVEPDASGKFNLVAGRGVLIDSPRAHTIRIREREDIGECSD